MNLQPLLYYSLQFTCRMAATACFRYRIQGRQWIPKEGGALLCSNHQSMFDPVLVGVASRRQCTFLARKTLFKSPLFRRLITALNAIPIDRDGFGLSGIKETIRRLRRGEMVVVFPEGTRSQDGQMSPLKPGICSIARRGRVPLIPIGIDGAFDALPRASLFPRFAPIHATIGEPITLADMADVDDAQLLRQLELRMKRCHARSRRIIRSEREA